MRLKLIVIVVLLIGASCANNATIRGEVKKSINSSASVGVSEYKKGNFESAKIFFNQALKDAYSIDNSDELINVYLNLAQVYIDLNQLIEASNAIFTAYTIVQEESISNYQFNMYLTLGKYYQKNGSQTSKSSEDYYNKALALAKTDIDKSIVYNNLGNYFLENEQYAESKKWLNMALIINEDKKMHDRLAETYFYLANLSEKQNQYNDALSLYKKALDNDKINENSDGILQDLKKISTIYGKINDQKSQIYYLKKAYQIALAKGYDAEAKAIQALIN